MIKEGIETDKLGNYNNNLEEEEDINLYHEIIPTKLEKDDAIKTQMEQWSLLSNVVNHVQYDRHPKNFSI